MKLKKIISLCSAAAVLSFAGCCAAPKNADPSLKKVTFVLDWTPNTNHAGLYVADALGYYAEEGIALEIVQPPEDGCEALVASGKAQFGISFQDTIAAAYCADEPLPVTNIAAVINHNTSGIISRKDKGITDFKQLEGHTYATWGGKIEQSIIRAAMEAQGGDFSKVNLVNTTVTDVCTALGTDMIDTVWVYEGWDVAAANIKNMEYNFISFAKADPVLDYYTPTIIASDSLLQSDPDLVRAFLRATEKGYEYCAENPQGAADIFCEAVPESDSELIHESMEFLSGAYIGDAKAWGYIDETRWADFYSWLYSNSLIEKDLGTFGFTNEFLPQ